MRRNVTFMGMNPNVSLDWYWNVSKSIRKSKREHIKSDSLVINGRLTWMMKPLVSMQRALTWFCVFPVVESDVKRKKIIYMMFSVIVFGTLLSIVPASVAFVWKYSSIDFEKSLDAVHPIMSWTALSCVFIIIIRLKHEIVELFGELSVIYNECKLKVFHMMRWLGHSTKLKINSLNSSDAEKEVFRYLARGNHQSEIVWEKYLKCVICGFGASSVLSYSSSFLGLISMKGDFDTENLYFQFKISYVL